MRLSSSSKKALQPLHQLEEKEWAALRSCYSVVCHESQSAGVCSVPRPNLHTPTINLLPGNPLPLTCLCVCLSACCVCVCEVLTSSWNCGESVRERGGKNGFGEDKGALLSKECTSLSCIFNFTYLHKEAIESLSCTVIVCGCYSGTATLGEITDFLTFNIVGNT